MSHSDERRRGRKGRSGGDVLPDASDMRAAGHRHARLERILREEIGALLRDEVDDPRVTDVVIVAVDLSPDYANARARFALRGEGRTRDEHARACAALERVSGFLRARLAESLDLKRTPQLRWKADPDASLWLGAEDEQGKGGGEPW